MRRMALRTSPALLVLCALTAAGCSGEVGSELDAGASRDGGAHSVDASSSDGATSARDAGDAAIEPADAGTDAAAIGVGCEGRDYLFCEDFESATPGTIPDGWAFDDGWRDGDPTVTDTEHRTGAHALRSALAETGQRRIRHALSSLGGARGRHWGRIFYKVETPFFVGGYVHSTMVGLIGSRECRVVDTVLGPSGSHQFLFNLPDDSCCAGSSYDYHSYDDEWHCAEWFVDASTRSYRFYFDGDEVTDIAFDGRDDAFIEDFSAISIGWRNYQTADPPYRSYLDDLAIDDERIGCD
jgi:hypothetical protein